jgi:hypothetical protein
MNYRFDMTKLERAHGEKVPFFYDGDFLDYETGKPYFNHRKFSAPYEGRCLVGPELFTTWIKDGERHWTFEESPRMGRTVTI